MHTFIFASQLLGMLQPLHVAANRQFESNQQQLCSHVQSRSHVQSYAALWLDWTSITTGSL